MSVTEPNISVVILTYNEEVNIRKALDSVVWCDNVVVIDSYSTDRTEEICRSYPNVTFIQNPFENFASQRRFALSTGKVRHPWILALDADESVPPDLRDELIQIAATYQPGKPVAYDIAMRVIMWGRWLRHSTEYPVYWRRFILAEACEYVQEGHADKVKAEGAIGRTRHDLIHDDAKGLSDWLHKHNRYTTAEAEYARAELASVPLRDLLSKDRMSRRRCLKSLFRKAPCNEWIRFTHLFILKRGFLDGRLGYELCRLRAFQHFIVKLKMRELSMKTECQR